MATTGGSDLEHKNYVGQATTIMRLITSKDGDLLSCVDEINENVDITSLKQILINNPKIVANRQKKDNYLLNLYLAFVKPLKRLLKA